MGAVAVFSNLPTTKKKQGKEDLRMKAVNERERLRELIWWPDESNPERPRHSATKDNIVCVFKGILANLIGV